MWRRAHLIVNIVTTNGICVHEIAAALRRARRALGYVGVVLGAPVVAKLVGRHQVGLARNHPLAVVVARAAQARVQVQRVAVLEVLGRADAADRIAARRAHIGQPQDAALELQVREQMGQTKVLVAVLAREHLQQIAHVPFLAHHVVVRLAAADTRRLRVHDNLLDHKAHAAEAFLILHAHETPEKAELNKVRAWTVA